MDFGQCRHLILKRLHERDKQTAQFEHFFRQCWFICIFNLEIPDGWPFAPKISLIKIW